MPARAAQDRFLVEFGCRPDVRLVTGKGCVTVEAWIPAAAAFEPDRDDIYR